MKIYIVYEYDWDYSMDINAYTNPDIAHEVCRIMNEHKYDTWTFGSGYEVKKLELIE